MPDHDKPVLRSRAEALEILICNMLRDAHTYEMPQPEIGRYIHSLGVVLHVLPYAVIGSRCMNDGWLAAINQLDPDSDGDTWGRWVQEFCQYFGCEVPSDSPRVAIGKWHDSTGPLAPTGPSDAASGHLLSLNSETHMDQIRAWTETLGVVTGVLVILAAFLLLVGGKRSSSEQGSERPLRSRRSLQAEGDDQWDAEERERLDREEREQREERERLALAQAARHDADQRNRDSNVQSWQPPIDQQDAT